MSDFLTQEQVNELPIGTRVEVVWSGGNGPHEYQIIGRHGEGRIIAVFELLDGSQFGDMFFGSHGDGDQWSALEARDENGDPVSFQESQP